MRAKLQRIKTTFTAWNEASHGPSRAEFIIAAALVVFTSLMFCFMKDFKLTVTQSLNFLDCLFEGKGLRFYSEINKLALSGYYGRDWPKSLLAGANYSVINYATVGLICFPVYIFDRFIGLQVPFIVYECIVKIVFSILFCYIAKVVYDICRREKPEGTDAKWISFCFLTSPVFLYSSIVISHLDIFSVLFLVLGFKYMMQGDRKWELLFFMLSATYKPFVLLGIIPILLMKEKRILYLARDMVVILSGNLLQKLIFQFDPGYGKTQKFMSETYDFVGRFFGTGFGFTRNCYDSVTSYFILAFVVVCVVAYMIRKPSWQYGFALAFGVMGAFVLFVKWHPNWMILIVPYIALLLLYTYNIRIVCLIEMVFSLFFILVSGFGWWYHYGIRMINGGVISQLLGFYAQIKYDIYEIIPRKFPGIPNDIYGSVLCAAVLGFILVFVYDCLQKKKGIPYPEEGRKWERCAVWLRVAPSIGYIAYSILVCLKCR